MIAGPGLIGKPLGLWTFTGFPAHLAHPILAILILSAPLFAGCASTGSNPVADMPHWMGGLPSDAPPRPGTAAYSTWQAKRVKEAARPKAKNAQQ
jgi:hypothetical protein